MYENYSNVVVLEQIVCIKITPRVLKYYREKGYSCSLGDYIYVELIDLPSQSSKKLWVQCSYCCKIKQGTLNYIQRTKSTLCLGCTKIIKNKNKFVKNATKVHGNKYDYSNSDYIGSKELINIYCKIHGYFEQIPNHHLRGHGCPDCGYESVANKLKKSNKQFIKEASIVHRNRYDYSLVNYKRSHDRVKIICKKHGVFEQIADSHINGQGCPSCKMSKGEQKIYHFLEDRQIKFFYEWVVYDIIRTTCPYKFDFYIENEDILIEFDGQGHYYPIEHFGGEKALKQAQKNDQIKNQWAKENNYKLIRIPYWDFDNIEAILTKELNL